MLTHFPHVVKIGRKAAPLVPAACKAATCWVNIYQVDLESCSKKKEPTLSSKPKESTVNMTTVTKTHHRKSYAAIAPQANPLHGRITLITGGGSGIGFAIASSAVAAKADRVIICGRREETLDEAVSKLTAMVPAGASTQISRYKADITSQASIDDMWKQLKQDKIEVNTLILNAAKLQYPSWDSDDAVEAVWNVFEGNVHACLRMTKAFTSQGPEHGKVG